MYPDAKQWHDSYVAKLQQLVDKKVLELAELPTDHDVEVLDTKIDFRRKLGEMANSISVKLVAVYVVAFRNGLSF